MNIMFIIAIVVTLLGAALVAYGAYAIDKFSTVGGVAMTESVASGNNFTTTIKYVVEGTPYTKDVTGPTKYYVGEIVPMYYTISPRFAYATQDNTVQYVLIASGFLTTAVAWMGVWLSQRK